MHGLVLGTDNNNIIVNRFYYSSWSGIKLMVPPPVMNIDIKAKIVHTNLLFYFSRACMDQLDFASYILAIVIVHSNLYMHSYREENTGSDIMHPVCWDKLSEIKSCPSMPKY